MDIRFETANMLVVALCASLGSGWQQLYLRAAMHMHHKLHACKSCGTAVWAHVSSESGNGTDAVEAEAAANTSGRPQPDERISPCHSVHSALCACRASPTPSRMLLTQPAAPSRCAAVLQHEASNKHQTRAWLVREGCWSTDMPQCVPHNDAVLLLLLTANW